MLMKTIKNDEPWPHYITDNYLSSSVFQQCVHEASLIKCLPGERALHSIPEGGPLYKKLRFQFLSRLAEIGRTPRSDEFITMSFTVCGVGYNYNRVHTDIEAKRVSTVVYLSDAGAGTRLYKDPNTYHSRIDWKPNRAITFFRNDNTWHDYGCDEMSEPRSVLVLNVMGLAY